MMGHPDIAGNPRGDGGGPGERVDRAPAAPSALIPAGAERFLSPVLWRQLTGAAASGGDAAPRRGVLLNAHERLRSLLFLLSTYLPDHLVQQKMRRPAAGQVDGRLLTGSFLFADVSGFTALSERLAVYPDGAERLTTLINAYMTAMLDVLSRSGGVLVKFAGDALLAYFPADESRVAVETGLGPRAAAQTAGRAVRAARRMMDTMGELVSRASAEGGSLRVKIGIGTGDCLAAAVGDRDRMEYFLLGGAVERMMAAESHAAAGQVVCDAATARVLDGQQAQGACWHLEAAGDGSDFYTVELSRFDDPAAADGSSQAAAHTPGNGCGDFEVAVQSRRARAVPWDASHHAVAAQMEVVVRQIEALVPFLAPELVDRIVAGAERRRVESEYRPAVVMFVGVTGPERLLPAQDAGVVAAASAVREATRLLDAYFRAVHRIIADRGGLVVRVDPYGSGTKMLVLFGAPVAHEDDALRAVGAALAMNEALATLNRRQQRRAVRSRPEEPARGEPEYSVVYHRIGIHCGLTFAGQAGSNTRREYTVMGDDVNLAARLMSAARWGQILVGRPVRDQVADRFSFEALSPIRVKGKRDAVEIFQARTATAAAPGRAGPPPRLVGREAELATGQRALDAALAGRGGTLIIGGAAGVGKSCLARALVAQAQERGARVLAVECRAYAAPPYAPWCALLHDLLDVPPPDPMDDNGGLRLARLLAALERLDVDTACHAPALTTLMGIPTLDQPVTGKGTDRQRPDGRAGSGEEPKPALFARLGRQIEADGRSVGARPAPGTGVEEGAVDVWQLLRTRRSPDRAPAAVAGRAGDERMWHRLQDRVASRQQERLADALAEALRGASTVGGPLVILIDHAQWLDDASRALLDLLLDRVAGARLLLIVAGRLEDPAWLDPILARHGTATPRVAMLRLDPLDAAATTLLARHWLATQGPAHVSGEPEYRFGVDDTLVATLYRRSGGNPLYLEELLRATLRAGVEESPDDGPEYFAGLVLSRVDALPADWRETVRAASVAGDVFRPSEVDVLLQAGAPPGRCEAPGPAAAAHDALAGLAAGDLLSGGGDGGDPLYAFRQALVRDVIYRSHSFARRRELHAALAGHLASRPGTEVTLVAHHYELAGRPQPAARYWLQAARRARARYAYDRAVSDSARALAALADLPPEEQTLAVAALQEALCVEQGDAYLLAEDFEAAATAYGQALARCASMTAPRVPAGEERGRAGVAAPGLSWRLALALAGSGREAEALERAEQAWAAACRPEQAPPDGQALDRLAIAATLTWILQRAGDRRAATWLERTCSLAREVVRESRPVGVAPRSAASGAQIARLAALVEETTAGGDDRGAPALLFIAIREVHGEYIVPECEPLDGAGDPDVTTTRRTSMTKDLLRQVSLFERLADETLAQVEAVVTGRSYAAGEVLFNKGDAGEELFIVKEGAIAIYEPVPGTAAEPGAAAPSTLGRDPSTLGRDPSTLGRDPTQERPLRIFRRGETLGEMALIDLQPRLLSARATEPTQVLVLNGSNFRSLLADTDVALGVMSGLNERIRYTTEFLGKVREWVGRMANGQYRETTQFLDEVQSWVNRVASGDYDGVGAPAGSYRDQSMAALAAEFARMATQVRQREDELRKEIAELKIELDQSKRQRQVEEITESDFFQELKTRAREMRRRDK